jgi:hypothetical protein
MGEAGRVNLTIGFAGQNYHSRTRDGLYFKLNSEMIARKGPYKVEQKIVKWGEIRKYSSPRRCSRDEI